MKPQEQSAWDANCRLLAQGHIGTALDAALQETQSSRTTSEKSRWMLMQGVAQALQGQDARALFHKALQLDAGNMEARLNLAIIQADHEWLPQGISPKPIQPGSPATRIAVLSFLFNWPSTGGGIVHTVELCDFLHRAGYEVQHIYARYDPWALGVVTQKTPMTSRELNFLPEQWDASTIL